jgi:FkbM family methyltransferase
VNSKGTRLMRRFVVWSLRPLKILVLWLTGQREAHERLSHLQLQLAQLEDAHRQRVPEIWAAQQEMASALQSLLHEIRGEFEKASTSLSAALIDEINRLDGYVLHHAAELRRDIQAIENEVQAARDEVQAARDEVQAARDEVQAARDEVRASRLLYAAPGTDAVLLSPSFDLVVPTTETGLLAYLTRQGTSRVEPAVRTALLRHLRPGMIAVDAGANIGLHSLVMAQAVGSGGRLIAFEALPHLAEALSRSLMLNGFAARSEVVQAALAEKQGEAVIHAAAHSPVSSIFAPEGIATTAITVPRISLDAHIAPGGRVDLIKMDIEGAEPLAWAGMTRVVAENPDLVIVLEWSASHFARSNHNAAAFMKSLQSSGFSPWLLRDNAPDAPERFNPAEASSLDGGNLLLLRAK